MKDTTHKFADQNPFYKDGKMFTSSGEPASSQAKGYVYKLKAPPKPARERVDEFAGQKKKANATAAIRGTTKVGAGAKNTVDISKLTGKPSGTAPRASSPAQRPLKNSSSSTRGLKATRTQGVSPRLQAPSGRRGPKPSVTNPAPVRRGKSASTLVAPPEDKALPNPQRRGPGPGPARRGPGPGPNGPSPQRAPPARRGSPSGRRGAVRRG